MPWRSRISAPRLTSGEATDYGFGLFVHPYRGVREVSHSGSTAGYRAFLARYPDQHVSVAVLCNVATTATVLAHAVADQYLGITAQPPAASHTEEMLFTPGAQFAPWGTAPSFVQYGGGQETDGTCGRGRGRGANVGRFLVGAHLDIL